MTRLARRSLVLAALAVAAPLRAQGSAPPAEVASALPGAHLQGSSRLRYFGLRIYEARLWMGAQPIGADWAATPFALELEYARDFKGEQIAERSLTEMKRQGEIAPEVATRWLGLLKELMPDVKEGDRITGVNLPGSGARLFFNGRLRGEPRDADFVRVFFGIWLSPRTSEPALREALLGRKTP